MAEESTQKENPIPKLFNLIEDIAKAFKGLKGTVSSHEQRIKALEQSKESNAGS